MKNTRHLGPGSSAVTTATARYAVAASDPFKKPRMARIKAIVSSPSLPMAVLLLDSVSFRRNYKEQRREYIHLIIQLNRTKLHVFAAI